MLPKALGPLLLRLGSIIPKDYQVSVDKWVQNEIKWRIPQVVKAFEWERVHKDNFVYVFCPFVITYFPDVRAKFGSLRTDAPLSTSWDWVNSACNFLWANRGNFKYDDGTRGYILRGKDLCDPENPPELPEELRVPPKPVEAGDANVPADVK
jgi:hypothetical protein